MWNALAIFLSNLIPSIASTDVSPGKLSLASLTFVKIPIIQFHTVLGFSEKQNWEEMIER